MSAMPLPRRGLAPRFNLGQLLASAAGAGMPPPPAPNSMGNGLGDALAGAFQPRGVRPGATTSPASGGVPPPPISDGEPVPPSPMGAPSAGMGNVLFDALDVPRLDVPQVQFPAPAPKPQGMGRGQVIAGVVADMLAGAAGREPMFAQTMLRQRERDDQRDYEDTKWHRERSAKREDDLRPRVEEVGGALGWLDPSGQSFKPFYEKPQVFESYARAQGLTPGTPEYAAAVEDYRLGSWSDPAMENRYGLEGVRYGHRDQLQDQRLDVTRRGQDIGRDNNIRSTNTSAANNRRSTSTSAANNQRSTSQSNTNSQRSAETTRGGAAYQGRGGRTGNVASAVGPDGRKIVVRNGRWVDEQTGRPVQ